MEPFKVASVLLMLSIFHTAESCTYLNALSYTQFFTSHALYGAFDYGNDLDECWRITAPSGKKVLVWTTSAIDTEYYCHDEVNAYCGSSSSGELIGRYCDGSYMDYIVSSSRNMYITFDSDSSGTDSGFVIYYRYVSSGTTSDCSDVNGAVIAGGIIAAIVIVIIIAIVVTIIVIVYCISRKNRMNRGLVHPNTGGVIITTTAGAEGYQSQPLPPPSYGQAPAYGGAQQPGQPMGAYPAMQPMGGFQQPPPPSYPPPQDAAYPPQNAAYPPPPPNPY